MLELSFQRTAELRSRICHSAFAVSAIIIGDLEKQMAEFGCRSSQIYLVYHLEYLVSIHAL